MRSRSDKMASVHPKEPEVRNQENFYFNTIESSVSLAYGPLHSTPIKRCEATKSRLQCGILDNVNKFANKLESKAFQTLSAFDVMKMESSETKNSIQFMIENKKLDLEKEKVWITIGRSNLKEYSNEIMENFRKQELLILQMIDYKNICPSLSQ